MPEAAGLPQGGKNPVGVVGDGRKIASSRAIRDFGIFKVGHFPMWGAMAQMETTTIMFQVKNAGEKHIDLSVAMGVGNCKQFHQFSKAGRPLCYEATIECIKSGAVSVATAPTNYCVTNSLVQASAAWNSQIKRTGVNKKKEVSRYGQRLRVGLIDDSVDNDGILNLAMEPYSSVTYGDSFGASYDPTETTPGGADPKYADIGEVTTFVVPGDTQDDEPTEEPVVILSGGTANSTTRFRTVREWGESRQGTALEPDEGREVTTSSKMFRMFSDAQPETDEIIVELDEYQEYRPYSNNSQYKYQDWGAIQTPAGTGQRSVVHVKAPCGLIQIGDLGTDTAGSTASFDQFLITVHAIYEM